MKEYSNFLLRHPEADSIFKLADLLKAAGRPIYFNAEDYDLEELASGDGESIWDDFDLILETQTGELIEEEFAPVSAVYDGKNFVVTDAVSRREYKNPAPEAAFEIFEEYFKRKFF